MTRKSSSNKRQKSTTGGGSPSGTSPATKTIANNLDLLSEILVRLPAKSLIQLESVSKHWISLISGSLFSTTHSSRNHSPSVSGLYSYEISTSDNSERLNTVSFRGHHNLPCLTFLDGLRGNNDSKPVIQRSLSGLILLRHFDDETTSYIVCNPTTKKCKTLPPGCFSKPPHLAYLAFDPSKSPCYRVVLISMSTSPRYCVDVYSSHDASWDPVFVEDRCFNGKGIFWNGAIHWLSDENGILRYDVDAMEMIAIPSLQNRKSFPLAWFCISENAVGIWFLLSSVRASLWHSDYLS